MISEEALSKLVEEIIAEAKDNGNIIDGETLRNRLDNYDISSEQVEYLTDKVEEQGVEITEDVPDASGDEFYEEIMREISTGDHVKLYLKDIGKFPLLSMKKRLS